MPAQKAPPARLERLTELVLAQLPGPAAQVRAAVDSTLSSAVAAAAVERHLDADDTALISGSSNAPPPVVRLIHALRDTGRAAIIPRCASCDKERKLPYQIESDARICVGCYQRNNAVACSRCGTERPVVARNEAGQPLCEPCQRAATAELCSRCGEVRPVAVRSDAGPLCQRCWSPPLHVCVSCGTQAQAHAIGPAGPLCTRCYQPARRHCGLCGEFGKITVAATPDSPDICERCYQRPLPACPDCGLREPCEHDLAFLSKLGDESFQLDPMALAKRRRTPPRPLHECSACGRLRPAQVRWPRGPVCTSCYDIILRNPAECAVCGNLEVLIGPGTCAGCSGATHDYDCVECGQPTRPVDHGRCPRCAARGDLQQLLATTSEHNSLRDLLSIVDDTDSPLALFTWLRRSPAAGWIRTLAEADDQILTHAQLDGVVSGKAGLYLRHLLVSAGILEERDEPIESLMEWLPTVLTDEHAQSRLVRQFTQWSVLRRARRRRRDSTENSARWARQQILVARDFCGWLAAHDKTVATCRQPDVDLWLATGSTRSYNVRYFIGWAQKQGECDKQIVVPLRQKREEFEQIAQDERWSLFQRLLSDGDIPADVRVAGSLVLVFGQHVSRVVALPVSAVDLSESGDEPLILLGRTPLALPTQLVDPLRSLIADSQRGRATVGRVNAAKKWLFPGGHPGRHIGSEYMRVRLADYGIIARQARNGALTEFAQDLPAEVLASVLGMHVNTAVDWRTRLHVDYTDYIAARHASVMANR